jgi:23S rRNA (adenine-N6)-dimethyltransferase
LTRALVTHGAHVVAVELDPALARDLVRRFADDDVAVTCADMSRIAWPAHPFSVVSNVPFAGSTAVLSRLLRDPRVPLRRADVILQWELAVKHAAIWPATLKGTYWRTWNEFAITRRLSRTAFAPAPKVDAALVRITPRLEPLVDLRLYERYLRFITRAFRAPGPLTKTLRSDLSPAELRRLANTHGFSPDAHARDLDVSQWAALFQRTQSMRR